MKIIKNKTDLPTPCKTCRKLRKTVRIPDYHCALNMHFPTKKNTCKRYKMKAQELFKKFLKGKGAFELYCQNFDENYECNTYDKIGKKIKGIYYFIDLAFLWQNTPQGNIFWSKMDDEWIKYIKRHW